ncbi:SLBB domain-containing protein [Winogradskyella sp.]|uniref:SLBB domain-containing protein n=1 Tax=Winogradskyella sp. TaxID=1883156 RepID=UPI003AB165A4
MRKKITRTLLILFITLSTGVFAQDLSQLKNVNISDLTDEQIATYWQSIESKGYSMVQLENLAKVQGVSSLKMAEFKRRVESLPTDLFKKDKKSKELTNTADASDTIDIFGLNGKENKSDFTGKEDLLFGYDFFNNPNISFTPNINVAVPQNYQLGPGDSLVIDLWGATEVTYESTINNQGAVKFEGIGLVYVSGLTLSKASEKIISKLKKRHAGISASKNSYNKIHTNVTLSKIRTVQVNIIGEVKVPATYSLVSLSTVLNALYAAGGPTKKGTFRDVKLVRNGKTIANFDIYKYLLTGSQEGNLKLQDQDVILIGPYKNLVTVKGAIKRPGIYELKDQENLDNLIDFFGGFTPEAYTELLVVERVNGKQREVKEVELENAKNFLIHGGDQLIVEKIVDKYSNRIVLEGAVFRPGNYELTDGMTLKNLLEKAEGVTEEAFMSRGLIVRSKDETNKINIAFSVSDILSGKSNEVLQAKDKIRIFNKDELREKQTITIQGAVNKPQTFEFVSNLQIEDLIAMSGGLTEGADANVVSISRRLKDGSFKTLSENFTISSEKNLELNNGSPFHLEPFDIINVRYLKGYVAQKTVVVKGEVKYQGNYVLSDKNERISDLVYRAGGITNYAYLKGATLIRKKNKESDKKQLELLQEINEKDSITNSNKLIEDKDGFKIGIDLDKIINKGGAGSDIDLFLEEGDELLIPSEKQTVEVRGEVLSPSLVQFKTGKSLKNYISNSGGYSQKAKKSKIFVLYSNGDIKTVKNFLFFKSYPKLEPGAVIFVPAKTESKRMTTQEILGITTSIGTLGLIIQSITK